MPAPTNVVNLDALIIAVEARLADQLPVTTPPTRGYLSEPVDVPLLDGQGHVQRYWVLHPFAGTPNLEHDIADTVIDSDWTFQITVAAAYPRDCILLASRINSALYRWIPVVDAHVCGPCKPPPGFDPGPPRPDEDFKPHRFWLPLQYRTTVTRTT